MDDIPVLKRPKLQKPSAFATKPQTSASAAKPQPSASATAEPPPPPQQEDISEEALLARVAHCKREVECCKLKLMHYHSLLDNAEKKLIEAHERLMLYLNRKPPSTEKDPNPSSLENNALAPTPLETVIGTSY
ncbi:hypothetical protein ABZP36_006603 [Zizania latifolia]